MEKDNWFVRIISLLFFSLGLYNILHHEMWRDELQAWSLVNHSRTIIELFSNTVYEGHPSLWFLILFPLSLFTDLPEAMQILHLLIATAGAFVFLKFAPFPKWIRVLFIFGYFPFFEYAVISRNYAIGLLILFSICALYPKRIKRFFPMVFLIALLPHTNIYGAIISIAFILMLVFAWFFEKEMSIALSRKKVMWAGIIIITGLALSIADIAPPADHSFAIGSNDSAENLTETIRTVWSSYVPVPQMRREFWDSKIIQSFEIQALLSIPILLIGLFFFIRKPVVFVLFFTGTLGMLAFTYLKYGGVTRHHGHLFVLFIICLWLAEFQNTRQLKISLLNKLAAIAEKSKVVFLPLLLSTHLVAAWIAIKADHEYVFSHGKSVANFIKEQQLDDLFIVGKSEASTSSVAGYLNKEIWYAETKRMGIYALWKGNPNIRGVMPDKKFLKESIDIMNQRKEDILVVYQLPSNTYEQWDSLPDNMERIGEFTDAIVAEENFFLYRLHYR